MNWLIHLNKLIYQLIKIVMRTRIREAHMLMKLNNKEIKLLKKETLEYYEIKFDDQDRAY